MLFEWIEFVGIDFGQDRCEGGLKLGDLVKDYYFSVSRSCWITMLFCNTTII